MCFLHTAYVIRTLHIGVKGVSNSEFGSVSLFTLPVMPSIALYIPAFSYYHIQYLNEIKLNDNYVDFSSLDLTYLNR